jgi:heptosyltransferase-2
MVAAVGAGVSRSVLLLYNCAMRHTRQTAPVASPNLKRILAVKLADMGDLLTITPALQALRAAHPQASIHLLVPPQAALLLEGAPYVDRILTFDKFPFDTLMGLFNLPHLVRTVGFLQRLRRGRYDAVLLFHHLTLRWGTIKFAVLCLITGARIRAGLDNGRGRYFLTHAVADRGFGAMHEADYWLSVAALLGADPTAGWRPHIPVCDPHRQTAGRLLASISNGRAGPLVAVHPGSGWYSRARIWPVERFAEVARDLIDTQGAKIIIIGGTDEQASAARLETLVDRGQHVLNLVGRTTIHETAAVLERCSLFVGNDSGPMHIAAAVGTPVVAVFGPSNQHAWRPYTPPGREYPRYAIVARDLPCMPCLYRGHSLGLREGCGTRPCLTGLPAGLVSVACRQMLAHR